MYSKILVPLDGSDASTCGLYEAIRIARRDGGTLRLLHVVKEPELDYGYQSGLRRQDVVAQLCASGKDILNSAETAARREGLAPECVMFESVSGPAAAVILDQAKQWPASLIVMGTHARHGFLHVGSDTVQVLADTPVPVLFVRGTSASCKTPKHRALVYDSVA